MNDPIAFKLVKLKGKLPTAITVIATESSTYLFERFLVVHLTKMKIQLHMIPNNKINAWYGTYPRLF